MQFSHPKTAKNGASDMFKNLFETIILPNILKPAIKYIATATIGAATAYMIDRGFLDGQAADAVANSALQLLDALLIPVT